MLVYPSTAHPVRRLLANRWAPVYVSLSILIFCFILVEGQTEVTRKTFSSVLPTFIQPTHADSAALAKLVHVPSPKPDLHHDKVRQSYKWYSDAKLRELTACMARGDCPKNADKVAIFNVPYCFQHLFGNYWGGEGTWCRGLKDSLERQGYTVLYTDQDWEYMAHIYRQIPDLVSKVLAMDEEPMQPYLKTKANPDGIPAWKFFRFWYYQSDGGTAVGDAWVVSCEPEWREPDHNFRNFTYLGYAMDPDLAHTDYIPFDERPYRAWVLGKHITFFYPRAHQAWSHDFYARALKDLRQDYPTFEFVGSFFDERGDEDKVKEGPLPMPEGIINLPRLNSTAFDAEIKQARMMVGIGWPTASPSPLRAFARGIPFLSPYKLKHDGTDEDPYSWSDSQHDTLRLEGEPAVYHVREFDYDGFVGAIRKAMKTPLEPFVYPRMTNPALDERVRNWMEGDWKSEAQRILDLRLAGIETQKTDWVKPFEM